MGFTITNIRQFNKNNYTEISKNSTFFVTHLLEKIENKKLKGIINKDDFKDILDNKDPFLGNTILFVYKNNQGEFFIEYISGMEIYNGNEEVNYISLMKLDDNNLQKIIKEIIDYIKENNYSIKSFTEGLLKLKKFLTEDLVIEYTNNTIMGSIDITGYEGRGKGQKAEYIKEKDIFQIIKEFSKKVSENNNVDSDIVYNYFKDIVLYNYVFLQKQNHNKKEQQIVNIVNSNLELLKNIIKEKIYIIDQNEIEGIDNIEDLINFIVENSEYILGLICEECSAINHDINIHENNIKFICKGCGKKIVKKY